MRIGPFASDWNSPRAWLWPGPTNRCQSFGQKASSLELLERIDIHTGLSAADLAVLYRNAAVYALSSDEEGFGITVAEAMASGLPVVATRCGGPDGIISDGVDGFLVKTGDAAQLANRLCEVLSDRDLHRRMSLRARDTAIRQYSHTVAGRGISRRIRPTAAPIVGHKTLAITRVRVAPFPA